MTEVQARAALRAFVGVGDIEPWIAGRPWKAQAGGWSVAGELEGWRFRLEVMPGGVRVIASTPGGGEPAVWFPCHGGKGVVTPLCTIPYKGNSRGISVTSPPAEVIGADG